MSESKIIDVPMVEQRSISIVTAEILTYKNQMYRQTVQYFIEIGRRLVEAKSMLEHGEWQDWLEKEVEFKQSTANYLMRIYQDYGTGQERLDGAGNPQSIEGLTYTQIVRLLSVPLDERGDFIRDNDVASKSSREIEQLVRERDEAKRQNEEAADLLEQADARNEELQAKYSKALDDLITANADVKAANEAREAAEGKIKAAKDAADKAKAKLKELKDNPSVPPEVLEKVKEEAEAAAKAAADQELEAKTAELRTAAEQARQEADAAAKQVEETQAALIKVKKELLLAEPEVTEFNLRLQTVAKDYQELISALDAIKEKNAEKGQKLTAAVRAMLEKFSQQIGG